ncbi:hypothetical protein ACXX82_18065 [Glaciimonas sp. GNP009]|uniref:hypothetical protein n=1 Tax=Glaciimonas sp. CA11.2 TaxID=3048601 RepID=UPI002AB4CA38|nr:hypothetical protein [Glaciimonas sp. CA11.2]MDY7547451.1 hypothetical protein [Glaciimonas sp. CA11.2]
MIRLPIIQLAGEARVVGEVAESAWILTWWQDAERIAKIPAPDHLVIAGVGDDAGCIAVVGINVKNIGDGRWFAALGRKGPPDRDQKIINGS